MHPSFWSKTLSDRKSSNKRMGLIDESVNAPNKPPTGRRRVSVQSKSFTDNNLGSVNLNIVIDY